MPRIKLASVRNMRDIGGISTPLGHVRAGVLYRSAHLGKLTARDADRIYGDLRVRTVVDLRTATERGQRPDASIAGVRMLNLPVFEGSVPGISHETPEAGEAAPPQLPDMPLMYREMVEGECLESLSAIVGSILEGVERGGVLFHCTEGKDRTGIVSMILLSMLGASREQILADYLSTNETARRRALRISAMVFARRRDARAARMVRGIFIADEAYLRAAMGSIEGRFESMDAFVHDGLGISDERLAAFRARMLEG